MIRTVALILVFLVVATLQAQADHGSLVGTWERNGFTMTLGADGKGTLRTDKGTSQFEWQAQDGTLTIAQGDQALQYQAALSGDTLTLSGGGLLKPAVLKRAGAAGASAGAGLVGRWRGPNGMVEFRPDGTMIFRNEAVQYRVNAQTITLTSTEGVLEIPYQLSGDTLIAVVEGVQQTLTRSDGEMQQEAGGGNPSELTGKWCYMSNVHASNGGRMSNRCFTLYENGTYEYYSETSSSGEYGGTASQESDSGTWTATESTITVVSQNHGTITYPYEKQNHPKTGDPMLVIDGDAYVTFGQRPPW
jgi:hypothetical protein